MRQVRRLFACRIATADNDQRLVAKNRQRAVASGTIGHALALQQFLAFQAEMPVRRACSDDDGLRFEQLIVGPQFEPRHGVSGLGKIHAGNGHAILRSGAETLGLLLHPHHQLRAVDALRETGVVLDDAGGREQPSRLRSREQQGIQVRSCRVQCRRPTRASRTDNDHVFHEIVLSLAVRCVRLAGSSRTGQVPPWRDRRAYR